MFIRVKANNHPHQGLWRAGRYFDGSVTGLEVVPGDDPRGPSGKDGKPSMEQITTAGYEALKGDGRLSFLADETDHEARDVAVAALRAELASSQSELATAKMRIAELEHGTGDAKAKDAAKHPHKGDAKAKDAAKHPHKGDAKAKD